MYDKLKLLNTSDAIQPKLIYRDRHYSKADILAKATELSEAIASRCTFKPRRTAVLLGNTPLFFSALFSNATAGRTSVLLSTHLKPGEVESYILSTKAEILITDSVSKMLVEATSLRKKLIHEEFDAAFGTALIYVIGESGSRQNCGSDYLTIQMTSGVNGNSKIVPRTYENLLDEVTNFSAAIDFGTRDVVACAAPLFHTYGFINGCLMPYVNGGTIILIDTFVPVDFVRTVSTYSPTIFVGVPLMYSMLGQFYLPQKPDFSSLRICFSAGVQLKKSVNECYFNRFGARINQQYGATETGVIAINIDDRCDFDCVGRVIPGRVIKVVDPEGSVLSPGEVGEIAIKSGGTAAGYLGSPKMSRTVFRGGWYFTGDLGCLDAAGNLTITGRKSSFINVAGLKVDPFDVELVLASNPVVKECAVVGAPHKDCGEVVKAYLVLNETADPHEIALFCKKVLADYKVPREIVFVDELPKSPTGKVLKKYLVTR